MITISDVPATIAALTPIEGRGPHTTEADVESAFATLGTGDFRNANVFIGTFDGNAGWERHVTGDELVHVVAGESHFDIIEDDERKTLELSAGMIMVVPRGCWHRFRSGTGVTVLTATPQSDEEHM